MWALVRVAEGGQKGGQDVVKTVLRRSLLCLGAVLSGA